MDVIEDVATLLHLVLDYLGIDMAEFMRAIHERLSRILRIRRQKSRWSLVRYVGAILPLRPARRIRLQGRLLGNHDQYYQHGSMESLVSMFSSEESEERDLVWVEEDLGDNMIQVRAENRVFLEGQEFGEDDGTFVIHKKEMTSTPINMSLASCSTVSTDPATIMKLTAMEDELAELRKQIALLVMSQETVNKSIRVEPDLLHTISPVTPAAPPPPPPPPPPPLPPPPAPGIPTMKTGGVSLADMIKQGKDHLLTSEKISETGPAHTGVPDMAQILKGLNTVKLKSVQRSPGGTPFRQKYFNSAGDPASIIAQALKKKFAHRHLYSPDNKENQDNSFSSPEKSPVRPFGQHILRKTNKRSSLVTDSTQAVVCGGPLQQRNS